MSLSIGFKALLSQKKKHSSKLSGETILKLEKKKIPEDVIHYVITYKDVGKIRSIIQKNNISEICEPNINTVENVTQIKIY